jgi:hypothetical protein
LIAQKENEKWLELMETGAKVEGGKKRMVLDFSKPK